MLQLFANLIHVEKLSVHPDDDFAALQHTKQDFLFILKKSRIRNQLMNQCFDVCEQNNC